MGLIGSSMREHWKTLGSIWEVIGSLFGVPWDLWRSLGVPCELLGSSLRVLFLGSFLGAFVLKCLESCFLMFLSIHFFLETLHDHFIFKFKRD